MKPFSILLIVIFAILFTTLSPAGPVAFVTENTTVQPNDIITIYLVAAVGVDVIGLGFDVIDDITPAGAASNPVMYADFDMGYEGYPSGGSVLYVMAAMTGLPPTPVTGTLWSFDYQVPDIGYPTAITIASDPSASEAPYVAVFLEDDSVERYVPDSLVLDVIVPGVNYVLTTQVIGGNGSLLPVSGSYEAGVEVILNATPASGYQVKKWTGTDDDTSVNTTNTVTMTSDKTVTVEFEPKPIAYYTLSASGYDELGVVSPSWGTYEEGTVVTLTAIPKTGYGVKAWYGTDNDASVAITNTVTMNSDRTVFVEFQELSGYSYYLTASVVGENGTVAPMAGTYIADTQVTLTATPDPGYQVKAWTGTDDDTSVETTNTVTMTSDKTVTVEFELAPVISYNLTASVVGENGTIEPTEGSYDEGTQVALTATPAPGYRVKEWIGTDISPGFDSTTNTVTMDSDKTVTVEFELIPPVYNLTASVVGGEGSILPTSGSYEEGTQVTLTATPNSGYRVKVWTGADSTPSAGRNANIVTMTSDKTVTVEFELIPVYNLTASVVGGNGSISPTSSSHEEDSQATLTATPDPGYRVKKWTGADTTPGFNTATNTVTMTGDKTVTVEFELIPPIYNLTASVVGGHGSISPTSSSYEEGTQVTLMATPNSGYRVKAWTGANNTPGFNTTVNTITMTGNKTVTVEFELIPPSYTLTTSVVGGHGTITPTSGSYEEGTQVTLKAIPQAGYHLKAWSGTDNDALPELNKTITMTGDKTVTVEFEMTMYMLTAEVVGGHGTLSPALVSYAEGTAVTLRAIPDNGYQVKEWIGTDDDTSVSTTNTVTMDRDQAIAVQFAASLLTDKCIVKAGNRDNSDSLQLSGNFTALASELLYADSVFVDIDCDSGFHFSNGSDPIPFDYDDITNGKFRYTRRVSSGNTGGITSFMFDLNRQTFSVKLDRISLTGLASPVTVSLEIGDYNAITKAEENTINGVTDKIPIGLMKTFSNELRMKKVQYRTSRKSGRDSLLFTGEIAVEDIDVDLFESQIDISWGDYSISIPKNTMIKKGNKRMFVYRKGANDPIAKAIIDLDRCIFNILIRNTTIPFQTSPQLFRISFNGFDESVLWSSQ